MGLFGWLGGWLGSKPTTRDVSGLESVDGLNASEVVDVSGGPLRESQRRLAIRDGRLLPKQVSNKPVVTWPRPKKPRYLSRDEARRLFSATMRTRNRDLRDLKTDEAQLERYGLPLWHDESELAASLGISLGTLRHFSIHRQRERVVHYVSFAIAKRNGSPRIIRAPKRRLKAIQRKLNELLIQKLPVSEHAHGFCQGRSIATNARPHVGRSIVVKLDLQDCFPTIHYGRIRGLLIAFGYSYPVATTLAVLMTESERQTVVAEENRYFVPVGPRVCVQGAPTSPGLCNAVMHRLDRRLAGLAAKYGFAYTRYADDLTFSADESENLQRLLTLTKRIIREEGFAVHPEKTRVMRRGQRQRVTGVTVNEQLGLSRRERRRLRAAVHQLAQQPESDRDSAAIQKLAGKLAYLNMLNPKQAQPLLDAFQKIGTPPKM